MENSNCISFQDLQQQIIKVNQSAHKYKNGVVSSQSEYNQTVRDMKELVELFNSHSGYCRKVILEVDEVLLTRTSKYIHDAVVVYKIVPDKEANAKDKLQGEIDELNSMGFSDFESFNTEKFDYSKYKNLEENIRLRLSMYNEFADYQLELGKDSVGLFLLVPMTNK